MTALAKNNAGNIVSSVRVAPHAAPSFEGQKHTPSQYIYDEELNEWVSFYWVDRAFRSDDHGAQCIWLDNNAESNLDNEFGIKLTNYNTNKKANAKVAAYAMYQRQKIAADRGLAPPVHGMCCFKYFNKHANELVTYWGYLTGVASYVGDLEENQDALDDFNAYYREQEERHEKLDKIEEILSSLDIYRIERHIEPIRENLGPHPDDLDFHQWCDEQDFSPYAGVDDLRRELECLSLAGCQSDWNELGIKFDYNQRMGGDLHPRNIGYWNGDLVCIDFGYHCTA